MSPRVRCTKAPDRTKTSGPVSILGRVFTENQYGPSGPEDNHVGLMLDTHGQMVLIVAGTQIPIDRADLRRISSMCDAEAAR